MRRLFGKATDEIVWQRSEEFPTQAMSSDHYIEVCFFGVATAMEHWRNVETLIIVEADANELRQPIHKWLSFQLNQLLDWAVSKATHEHHDLIEYHLDKVVAAEHGLCSPKEIMCTIQRLFWLNFYELHEGSSSETFFNCKIQQFERLLQAC